MPDRRAGTKTDRAAVDELRPWESGESILAAVRRYAPAEGDAFDLPDEPPADLTQIGWSAGSWDGVIGHLGLAGEERGLVARVKRRLSRQPDPAARLYSAVADLARNGGDRERLALYR